MKPILEIKNVSKKYNIHHEGRQSYLSLRDSVMGLFKSSKISDEEFYALNDVSFDVYPGDSIGVIGRNGAGKSTLLKILSKITPPSTGKITCRGRIASLLEVGTGFHSELSGRENIYLNGSILGLRKREIENQFDAIVDFSGVEKFLDTPLKHYSSGMQLRLAFAVAAHLEPEILIIDEVLAVGDTEFQKKCLGKMNEVSKGGRTILFVSHNMGVVNQLCKKAIVLNYGKIAVAGTVDQAVDYYLNESRSMKSAYKNEKEMPDKEMYFRRIIALDNNNAEKYEFAFSEHIFIQFEFVINKFITGSKLGFAMLDNNNNRVFSEYYNFTQNFNKKGVYSLKVKIPSNLIAPNTYTFLAALLIEGNIFHLVEEVCPINIIDTGTELSIHSGFNYGSVILNCEWN
jgi:lipopolysaccharide transport system ATP-binding protein